MTTQVTIEASFANGKPLDVLSDLIARRQQYLKGETTERAVTATAINILTALRARTKKPKPKEAAQFGKRVLPAPGVVAGWKGLRGASHRIVRTVGGHEMQGSKIVNLAGAYRKGENILSFVVLFKSPKIAERLKGGHERFYVVAKNANDVKKWAENRIKKYVKVYGGMANWVLGQAQSQIAQKGFSGSISNAARAVALKNLTVDVVGDGFGSGRFEVFVDDRFGYAKLALDGGPADYDVAVRKAANRTAAIINKLGGYAMDEEIPTPFPESKGDALNVV